MFAKKFLKFVLLSASFLTLGCSMNSWTSISSQTESVHRVSNGTLEIVGELPDSGYLPLMDELKATLRDMQELLDLPDMRESARIQVFSSDYDLEKAIRKKSKIIPLRRTYFFENISSGEMEILVKYTDYIADDLRHESAHAYLHGICSHLPLWLDEGLAEYFEPSRTTQGYQPRHINRLMRMMNSSSWKPNLARLDALEHSIQYDLTVEEYAHSWIWVHFLINDSPETKRLLQNYLQGLERKETPTPLSEQIRKLYPDCDSRVTSYLLEMNRRLAEEQAY